MRYRTRPYFNSTVDTETAEAIIELANNNNIHKGRALDLIVQEWRTGKEMKPLSTKKEVNETILEVAIKGIEERLNQIEGQLADGQAVILHKD